MVNYCNRIITVRGLTLAIFFFSLIFVCKMCVFVSRLMKCHFTSGKRHIPKQKSWKSSRISTKKSCNNNGKPWKSSRILRVRPNFFIFSLFIIFHHFLFCNFFTLFTFFHFFVFHFFVFSSFLSFLSFFSFFHFFLFLISFISFHFFIFSHLFIFSFL